MDQGELFGVDVPTSTFNNAVDPTAPLAARMRPRTLDEYFGQSDLIRSDAPLRAEIQSDSLRSAILWGPPGCGKSTLAHIIAATTKRAFENYSAVTSGVADIRNVIERAETRRRSNRQGTILFVDEIHRWNKAQQDGLLPHVESGLITLLGATTENPYFSVNGALLSRSRIFRLKRLLDESLKQIVLSALTSPDRGLGLTPDRLETDALEFLVATSGGDARHALNALETAAGLLQSLDATISVNLLELAMQQRAIQYDRDGDEHYDTISAFIKSVRGSDPDASLYWLAKMLLAGEDPKFIVRRLLILASEDIGLADPMALTVAVSAMQTVQFIGMPEAQLTLSEVTIYLAMAPKSNSATTAIGRAQELIKATGAAPVPQHLRDTHYPGSKKLGHGQAYLYPHDFPNNFVDQSYVTDGAIREPLYQPGENVAEQATSDRLQAIREASKPD
ncbi:MAG: replication-associated recombination protein A [Chthonomonadales bacterium]